MRKRKLFIVRGNFQVKTVLCYVYILTSGIFGVAISIYHTLADVVEEAAFSAHLSYASSGELFWETILKTNLVVGGVSILFLLLIIGFVHIYLNKLFTSLEEGVKLIGRGKYTYRIDMKGKWLGQELLADYNLAAQSLHKNKEEIASLLHLALRINFDSEGFHGEIQRINDRLKKLNYM